MGAASLAAMGWRPRGTEMRTCESAPPRRSRCAPCPVRCRSAADGGAHKPGQAGGAQRGNAHAVVVGWVGRTRPAKETKKKWREKNRNDGHLTHCRARPSPLPPVSSHPAAALLDASPRNRSLFCGSTPQQTQALASPRIGSPRRPLPPPPITSARGSRAPTHPPSHPTQAPAPWPLAPRRPQLPLRPTRAVCRILTASAHRSSTRAPPCRRCALASALRATAGRSGGCVAGRSGPTRHSSGVTAVPAFPPLPLWPERGPLTFPTAITPPLLLQSICIVSPFYRDLRSPSRHSLSPFSARALLSTLFPHDAPRLSPYHAFLFCRAPCVTTRPPCMEAGERCAPTAPMAPPPVGAAVGALGSVSAGGGGGGGGVGGFGGSGGGGGGNGSCSGSGEGGRGGAAALRRSSRTRRAAPRAPSPPIPPPPRVRCE